MMKIFTLQDISKYRTELMGFAILGVLVGHIIDFSNFHCPVLNGIMHGIHTPGFLFLSGFGLFYSLSNDGRILQFYKRRLWRFYIPFVMITLPFSLRSIATGNFHFLKVISELTTINFWINGNSDGMWYIAISLVLYMITPPIYTWLSTKYNLFTIKVLIIISVLVAFNYFLSEFYPHYWEKISIGLKNSHLFFIGILVARETKKQEDNKCLGNATVWILSLLYLISVVMGIDIPYVSPLIKTCFFIMIVCCVLNILKSINISVFSIILKWLGRYTLELYILHLNIWAFLFSPVFQLGNQHRIIIAVLASVIGCVPVHNTIKFLISKIHLRYG